MQRVDSCDVTAQQVVKLQKAGYLFMKFAIIS